MKKAFLAVLVVFALAGEAWCQLDLFKIGNSFGPNSEYQIGFNKSTEISGCVQRELYNGQWLAGPCRDLLILTKNGTAALHLGVAVMYNAEHGNANYDARLGVTVGPAVKASFRYVVGNIPYLSGVVEYLAHVPVPPAINYLGNVLSVDYAIGLNPVHTPDVIGVFRHGPMFKLDIPLQDVLNLLPIHADGTESL